MAWLRSFNIGNYGWSLIHWEMAAILSRPQCFNYFYLFRKFIWNISANMNRFLVKFFSINFRDTISGFVLLLCQKVAVSLKYHQTNISFIYLHWNEASGDIQGNLDRYGFDISATSPRAKSMANQFSPWVDYAIATQFNLGGFASQSELTTLAMMLHCICTYKRHSAMQRVVVTCTWLTKTRSGTMFHMITYKW